MKNVRLLAVWAIALCATVGATAGAARAQQRVQVTVKIEFGAGRPALERKVEIERGASVVVATRAAAPVEQDWLCCSKEDVWSIDGVGPDPRLDRYWFWTLDGKGGPNLPARHKLEGGENIGWKIGEGKLSENNEVRVVSLLPAATEIAIAVGAERSLVALSHLCRQPDGRELPRVMSTSIDSEHWSMKRIDDELKLALQRGEKLYALDEERIRALEPTHVLSQGLCPVCAVTPDQVGPALGQQGERCAELVVLSPHSLADIAQNIRDVGTALGRASAGQIAARAFERRFEALRALPPLPRRPRVAVLEWFDPLWASGEWIAEMVEVAGGEPVLCSTKEASKRVEWKDLVAADPDVIVLAACSMSLERTQLELPALEERPEWAQLRAVKARRVIVMDGEMHVSTPGPGVAYGAEALARWLRAP
ncbi:MAG: ABC transporter substrate-binding protein [Planctomycetes bacterium]|nr:ABC transporter substrate-binding protein [Planctomycetota bacterium]